MKNKHGDTEQLFAHFLVKVLPQLFAQEEQNLD